MGRSPVPQIAILFAILTFGMCANSAMAQDYGDAPASYGDAIHTVGGPVLGLIAPDSEVGAATPLDGSGDDLSGIDDEDSVDTTTQGTFSDVDSAGATRHWVISTTNTTGGDVNLYGWIDFDRSGTFDANEQATALVANGATTATLSWTLPALILPGDSYARFRITSDTLTSATGSASDGEVEDYAITISNFSAGIAQCADGFYQTRAPAPGTPYNFDLLDFASDPIGETAQDSGSPRIQDLIADTTSVNAIGFNVNDGYIYGATWASNDPSPRRTQIIRINPATGQYQVLGDVLADGNYTLHGNTVNAGDPLRAQSVLISGDVDRSGRLYLGNPNRSDMVVVDLQAMTFSVVVLTEGGAPASLGANDISFNPQDGNLYAVRNASDILVQIDPASGVMTTKALDAAIAAAQGGAVFDQFGSLYALVNSGGGPGYQVFRVNVADASPTLELVGTGSEDAASNDAAGCLLARDYGDAPDSYGTLLASGGASHVLTDLDFNSVPDLFMGAAADSDLDGFGDGTDDNGGAADDDLEGSSPDDEDGITSFTQLSNTATAYSVDVAVTNNTGSAATLWGWVDFDQSGAFEAGEAASIPVGIGISGSVTLNWSGLSDLATGTTYARFRLTTDTNITASTPAGAAADGEVEDYPLTIHLQPWSCESTADGILLRGSPSTLDLFNLVTSNITNIDTLPYLLNGMGYNVLDDYVYAIRNQTNQVYRIGSDGSLELAFTPAGMLPRGWAIGDIDPVNGIYYLGLEGSIHAVDLNPGSPTYGQYLGETQLTLGGNPYIPNIGDWSVNPVDNLLYTVANNGGVSRLLRIDPATGVISNLGTTGAPPGFGGGVGASFFDSAGTLYIYINFVNSTRGEIWRITGVAAGDSTAFKLINSGAFGNTDGARCSTAPLWIDFGDAPDSFFNSLLASDGARHVLHVPTDNPVRMGGPTVDPELDANTPLDGNGDDATDSDDEDGVAVFPAVSSTDTDYTFDVNVTNTSGRAATLFGWVDWNGNRTFDPGEATSAAVPDGTTGGTATLTWSGLSRLVGINSFVRLRITTDTNITTATPSGPASDGEVEDHPLTIAANPGVISGSVLQDTDGNGSGDSPLQGVAIQLWADSNADGIPDGAGPVAATTTAADGSFSFTAVTDQNYVLVEVDPVNYSSISDGDTSDDGDNVTNTNTNDNWIPVTLFGNEIDADNRFVDVRNGDIAGTVWLDNDADGAQDIGEPGKAGVMVYLCASGVNPCNAANAISTAVTDTSGHYTFADLPSGDYQVQVDPGELSTGELTGLEESPGNIAGNSVVSLLPGEIGEADFGYVPAAGTAVIEGAVWSDADGDGIHDPGEIGIEGISVDLWEDTDGDGILDTIVGSATTGPDGSYQVTGITFAGNQVTDGRELVAIVDTGDPELIAFCDPVAVADCDTTPTQSDPVTVMPNDLISDADFGFDTSSTFTVQDRIWNDENGDGVLNAGESGIGGVGVALVDSNGNIVASVLTQADGTFSFEGIDEGDYVIRVIDDSGALDNFTETTATGGGAAITVNAVTTNGDGVLDTVGDDGTPTFGYNMPSTIAGSVFSDPDNSGTLDSDESGIALDATGNPVIVELLDSTCTPGVDCLTTTLNPDGSYVFSGLPPGDYTVVVTNPPAGTSTTGGDTQNVSLGAGESAANLDFGYNDPGKSDISGTIFKDLDTDGTYEPDGTDGNPATVVDNETGLDEVTVELINCGTGTCFDGDETTMAMTVTAADGSYTFADVPDGDYLVKVSDTGNKLDGYELTSGLDLRPVKADSASGDLTDVDFGYVDDEQTASITSGLWIDSDKDGVRDPDETPIPNVDINLIDCGPDAMCGTGDDTVVGTAMTDTDGNVMFDELPPGVYQLLPDTTDPDFPADLDETTYSGNDPNDPINLAEGEAHDAGFGYIPDPGTAGFSGTIWNDSEPDGSDGDGIRDASEVGLGGIPVSVTNVDTGAVVVTTTAPDGSYMFTGLTPCPTPVPCYQVTYDEPSVTALGMDGTEPTNTDDIGGPLGPTTPDGVNDNSYLIHLEDGDFKEAHDFGFDAPANTFGSVDGYVYYEPAPANGDRDGSDTSIASVTVNLVDSNGDVIATTTTSDGFTDVDGDGVIDPAGYYSFTNLVPGDYTVVVTDTNNATIGLNPTENPAGTSPTLMVTAGGLASSDFGYAGEQNLGNIGNLIWLDAGGPGASDGLFDPLQGDRGIAGVTVECWFDADGDKSLTIAGEDNLVRTVTTDENGEYYCEGLPTGGYLVRVTDEQGRLEGAIASNLPAGGSLGTDGLPGTTDDLDNATKMGIPLASIPTSGPSASWYIETGSDNLTADFAVTGTNSLGGSVFEETAGTTANGLQDGSDAGAPGVTVILFAEQPDGSFKELTRTTTDASGNYAFTGLPVGNYQVVVDTGGSAINGYGQTGDPDIPTSFCTSALAPLCDDMAGSVTPIALTGSTNVTGVDFGYQTEFVTTPITLGYFHVKSLGGGSVEISWQTVTEVAHLGFNLYVREPGSDWRRLNAELIAPAGPGDSFDTREYTFTAYGVNGKRFALGDVDVTGKETIHGPFKLDRKAGADRAARSVTDWDAIQAKRAGKKAAREARRKAKAQKRLQRTLQKSKARTNGDTGVLKTQIRRKGKKVIKWMVSRTRSLKCLSWIMSGVNLKTALTMTVMTTI